MLDKTLESALDCKELQLVNPKGNQSWIFIGRTDAEAETPILWPPDAKNWLIWKDPDAGKDWRWEGKRTTEDEMVGWHYQIDGHEFEQASGVDGQGSLACCSPQGRKESDTTEQMNWTELLGDKRWWWWQGHKKRPNSEYVVFEVRSNRMSWKLAVMWEKDMCLHDHHFVDLSN